MNKEELVFVHWQDKDKNPVSVGYRVDEDSNTFQYVVARKNPSDQENRKIARHVIREKFLNDEYEIVTASELLFYYEQQLNYYLRQRTVETLKVSSFNHAFYHLFLLNTLDLFTRNDRNWRH